MDEFGTISNADLIRLDYVKKHGIPPDWKNKKPRRWFWNIIMLMIGSGLVITILAGCVK